jgi:adenylylsulfate kinase
MRETHTRSIVKGITWRIIASATTMLVVFLMTGDLALVASVGFIDVTAKLFFYYLHERTWGKVHWGVLGPIPKSGACICGCHSDAPHT